MNATTVKLVENASEMEAAKAIRIRVFVHEQGVPMEEEMDEADADAIHALALLGTLPVGTGRLLILPDGEAQIGRMAVDLPHRRAARRRPHHGTLGAGSPPAGSHPSHCSTPRPT